MCPQGDDAELSSVGRMSCFNELVRYAATRLRLVGSIWSDPAHNTNRIHVVLAEDAVPAGEHDREAGEELETLTMPVAEAIAGVTRGMFVHAMHLGGLLLALQAAGRIRF